MSNYRRILQTFNKIGYNESSHLNQYEINSALDKIAVISFNREVAQQLYEQTAKEYNGEVVVQNYITTIIKGQDILLKHIKDCNDKIKSSGNQNQIREIRLNLDQYIQDYKLLTQPFNIDSGFLVSSNPVQQVNSNSNNSSNISAVFTDQPSNREESIGLKYVLVFALLSFVLEMIMMFVKDHFLSMLTYLAVLGIFLLNYFDKHYIKSCVILSSISLIFDLIWIIAQSDEYWNTSPPTQLSTLQPGFLKFTYIMTIIMMISKFFIATQLFRYRNNDSQIRKKVKILNLRFDLDGKPKNSPIYNIWTNGFPKQNNLNQHQYNYQ